MIRQIRAEIIKIRSTRTTLGLVAGMVVLVIAIFALPAGMFVDHHDRWLIASIASLVQAVGCAMLMIAVYLDVRVKPGITKDHAHTIFFTLSDNARTKANLTADFGFFDTYFNDFQAKAKGVAPKL